MKTLRTLLALAAFAVGAQAQYTITTSPAGWGDEPSPSAFPGAIVTVSANTATFGTTPSPVNFAFDAGTPVVVSWSPTQVKVLVPVIDTGSNLTGPLMIGAVNVGTFTVLAKPAASAIAVSVTPTAGGVGATVNISGSLADFGTVAGQLNFTAANPNAPAEGALVSATIVSWSSHSIQALVPALAATGPLQIIAHTAGTPATYATPSYSVIAGTTVADTMNYPIMAPALVANCTATSDHFSIQGSPGAFYAPQQYVFTANPAFELTMIPGAYHIACSLGANRYFQMDWQVPTSALPLNLDQVITTVPASGQLHVPLSALSTTGANSGNVLYYNGSVWAPLAIGATGPLTYSAGFFGCPSCVINSGSYSDPLWLSLSAGFLGASTARWNANLLQGRALSNAAPGDGYSLNWSASNNQWQPTPPNNNANAITLQGRNVAATAPTDGYSLNWSATNNQWQPGPGGSGGAASTALLTDAQPANSSTVLTVQIPGAGTRFRSGTVTTAISASPQITLGAGAAATSTSFWVYFDTVAQQMRVATSAASFANITLANATAGATGASGVPPGAIPLQVCTAGTSVAGAWDSAPCTDQRGFLAQAVTKPGSGLSSADNSDGSRSLNFDPTQSTVSGGRTGEVAQTPNSLAGRWFYAEQFGAVGDLSTDDTTAVQAAITAACGYISGGGSATVVLRNNRISSALSYSSCASSDLHMHIIGRISLGVPLIVGKPSGAGSGVFEYLSGEGFNGTQFQLGSVGYISCDDSATWTSTVSGSTLFGTAVPACLIVSSGAKVSNIYVKALANGPGIYIPATTGVVWMSGVGSSVGSGAPGALSVPILVDATEWLWIDHSVFIANGWHYPAAMHFTSTFNPFGAGLIYIADSILSNGGIAVDGGSNTGTGFSSFGLHNISTETISDALFTVDASKILVNNVMIDGYNTMADTSLNPAQMTLAAAATASSTTNYQVSNVLGYFYTTVSATAPLYFRANGTGGVHDALTCTAVGPVSGTVDVSGTSVTWDSGQPFSTIVNSTSQHGAWGGLTITINGVNYVIASNPTTTTSLTLTTSAGTQTAVPYQLLYPQTASGVWTPGVLTCNTPANSYAANTSSIQPFPRIVRSLVPAYNKNINNWSLSGICGSNQVLADFPVSGSHFGESNCQSDNIRHAQTQPYTYENNGVLDAELTSTGANALTLAPFQAINVQQSAASWNVSAGTGTITAGQLDPWGGTSGGLINCTTSTNCTVNGLTTSSTVTLNVGDMYCVVYWRQIPNATGAWTPGSDIGNDLSAFSLLSSGAVLDVSGNTNMGAQYSADGGNSEGRWTRVRICGTITNVGSSHGFQFTYGVQGNSSVVFAKPSIVYIPASANLSPLEVSRLVRNIGVYPSNLAAATTPRIVTFPETQLCWGANCMSQSSGLFAFPGVSSGAGLQDTSTAARPTCNAAERGTFYVEKGTGTSGADQPLVCEQTNSTGPTYGWVSTSGSTPVVKFTGNAPAWLRFEGDGADGASNCNGTISQGEHHYTTFTVSSGNTCAVASGSRNGVIIRATGACTIAGTLNDFYGSSTSTALPGDSGGGGGGGGGGTAAGTSGASSIFDSYSVQVAGGGSNGASSGGAGVAGSTPTSAFQEMAISTAHTIRGGSAGGNGGSSGGAGGQGGGALVLVCDSINFTGTISVAGNNGTNSAANNTGSGGGGGGGVIVLSTPTLTANTGTLTVSGGAGGTCGSFTGCGAGGAGGAGWSAVLTIQ